MAFIKERKVFSDLNRIIEVGPNDGLLMKYLSNVKWRILLSIIIVKYSVKCKMVHWYLYLNTAYLIALINDLKISKM